MHKPFIQLLDSQFLSGFRTFILGSSYSKSMNQKKGRGVMWAKFIIIICRYTGGICMFSIFIGYRSKESARLWKGKGEGIKVSTSPQPQLCHCKEYLFLWWPCNHVYLYTYIQSLEGRNNRAVGVKEDKGNGKLYSLHGQINVRYVYIASW